MAAAAPPVKPASREELEAFVAQNKRWLPDDAEQILRNMSAIDQRRVIGAGTMSSVRDPAAVIQARVRKAREMEAQIGRGQTPGALSGLGEESRISKPATREELDSFVKANERWLQGEAADILRAMSPVDQKRVISAGTMSGCRDPIAVIQTRAKKAREMEMELESLAAGQRPAAAPEPPQMPPAPVFCEAAAAMHLYAPPEVVTRQDSKFAPPPSVLFDTQPGLVGEERGIGGVVEILKAKYGCGKGQRLKVIGETGTLLQFEGGKTAPKNQEDKGWKWVLREDEESKRAYERAQLAEREAAEARRIAEVAAAKGKAELVKKLDRASRSRSAGKRRLDGPILVQLASKLAPLPKAVEASAGAAPKPAAPRPAAEVKEVVQLPLVEKLKASSAKEEVKESSSDSSSDSSSSDSSSSKAARKGKDAKKVSVKDKDKRKRAADSDSDKPAKKTSGKRDDKDDKKTKDRKTDAKAKHQDSDEEAPKTKEKDHAKKEKREASDERGKKGNEKKSNDKKKRKEERDKSTDDEKKKPKDSDSDSSSEKLKERLKARKRKCSDSEDAKSATEKDKDRGRGTTRKKAHYGSEDVKAKAKDIGKNSSKKDKAQAKDSKGASKSKGTAKKTAPKKVVRKSKSSSSSSSKSSSKAKASSSSSSSSS